MAKINENYNKLVSRYLFSEVGQRTQSFIAENPEAKVIKLGIGDTTQPLVDSVISAFKEAADDLAVQDTYLGYGPYLGYEFLRKGIQEYDFKRWGVEIELDEIFVSDGSKCDTGNILDIFGENTIAVSDPAYPVYVDTNVMAGNTGEADEKGQYAGLVYLPTNEDTGFKPVPPKEHVDLIYLCSPNNPTGVALNKEDLTEWVNYALEHKSIIIFDAAYERFIEEPGIPHSIYEIEGAKKCAIEFRSFSKTAGFTGVRCAYAVVPKQLYGEDSQGNKHSIRDLWFRRQSTKYNGLSYPVQKAAAAIFTEEGDAQVTELLQVYKKNAEVIRKGLDTIGFTYFGGVNSPYIWLKCPNQMSSWDFFDLLLEKLHIVGTPGSGFGPSGEGYFRLTAFGDPELTKEAVQRIVEYDWTK